MTHKHGYYQRLKLLFKKVRQLFTFLLREYAVIIIQSDSGNSFHNKFVLNSKKKKHLL